MSAQRRWSLLSASIVLLLLGTSVTRAEEEGRPNIVILLSDNLGYGELGSYGGGVLRGSPTPRLDALAKDGLRLTNFNVEVECTPSRSALMTGRMPIRSGTWRAGTPGLPGGLAPWEVTIAETLSDAGYATAIFGKWHLGDTEGRFPTNQGFDTWWGFPFSTNVAMDTPSAAFFTRRWLFLSIARSPRAPSSGRNRTTESNAYPLRQQRQHDEQEAADHDGDIHPHLAGLG